MKIFIVEDDVWYGEMLRHHLAHNPDNTVELLGSGKELMARLREQPAVITLDFGLPDTDGSMLLEKLKKDHPNIPVIVISGQEDVSTAIDLLKKGAYDYLVKDEETQDRLWHLINRLAVEQDMREELSSLRKVVATKYKFDSLIKGNSPAMQRIFELLKKAASANITVSITGETGTGKELVAKAIHFNCPRAKHPFVAINMSAIPDELVESELFGHEKGAFTGAVGKRKGKFEEAHKGTLFLDEIGDLPLPLQAKLLRVLQERELTPLGSNKATKIDTRVIVATHKNLAEQVRAGKFREDLYYRLLGLPIELPPLRDRGQDVLLLAKFFTEEACKENGKEPMALSQEVKEKLMEYPFPGNIRELKAIMELAVVMADGDSLNAHDVNFSSPGPLSDLFAGDLTLKDYNRKIIAYFLDKYDNDVQKVATKLDIGKSTIYNMKKAGEL